MRIVRAARRAASSAGMIVMRKCSNGVLSRKNNDSLVIIASTTAVISAASGAAFSAATSSPRLAKPALRATGKQPAFDQILLVGRQHEARALLEASCAENRNPAASRAVSREQPDDFRCDFVERQHGRTQAGLRDGARHAPHHAGRFILRDHAAAGGNDRRPRPACRRRPCRSEPARGAPNPRPQPPRQTARPPRACRN